MFCGYKSEQMPKNEEAIKQGIITLYFAAWHGYALICANLSLQRKRIVIF